MPERQSRHPDNDIIEAAAEDRTPGQQGSAGGNVNRQVGSRAELNRAEGDEEGVERAVGSDNPKDDAKKGPKSTSRMQGGG